MDLQVDGTQTIVNSTTKSWMIRIFFLDLVLNDAAADGGGMLLSLVMVTKLSTGLTPTDSWTFSENVDLAATKTYKINNVDVLTSTTLGSGVVIAYFCWYINRFKCKW